MKKLGLKSAVMISFVVVWVFALVSMALADSTTTNFSTLNEVILGTESVTITAYTGGPINGTITEDLTGSLSCTARNVFIESGTYANYAYNIADCSVTLNSKVYTAQTAWVSLFDPTSQTDTMWAIVFGANIQGRAVNIGNRPTGTWSTSYFVINFLDGAQVCYQLNASGTGTGGTPTTYTGVDLQVSQLIQQGIGTGFYNGPITTDQLVLDIVTPSNPYYLEGFEISSYISAWGNGQFHAAHFPSGGSLNVYAELDGPLIGSGIALAPTPEIATIYHSCEAGLPPGTPTYSLTTPEPVILNSNIIFGGILSPDGKKIVYTESPLPYDIDRLGNLFIKDLNTGAVTQLTQDSDLCRLINFLSWTPDGNSVFFTAYDSTTDGIVGDSPRFNIKRVRIDTQEVFTVLSSPPPDWYAGGQSTYFPSGNRILYLRSGGVMHASYINNDGSLASGTEIQLTNFSGPNIYADLPQWSPSGDKIVFSVVYCCPTDWSTYEIYLLTDVNNILNGSTSPPTSLTDSRIVRLTNNSIMSAGVSFTSDGDRILYGEELSGTLDLDNLDSSINTMDSHAYV